MEFENYWSHKVTLHPLETPLILEHIFEHLNFHDLKTCRQVSKLWRHYSMRIWRNSARVSIRSWEFGKSMSDFLSFFQRYSTIYPGQPLSFNYSLDRDSSRFWAFCGAHLKILSLYQIQFQSSDALLNVVLKFCFNVQQLTLGQVKILQKLQNTDEGSYIENKNLKKLSLNYLLGNHGIPWIQLLKYFPSLESVTMYGSMYNANEFFRSINQIRKINPGKLKLKNVKTGKADFYKNPSELFEALEGPDINLIGMSIRLCCPEESKAIQKILNNHAKSLKKLTVIGVSRNPLPIGPLENFILPVSGIGFENLQKLVLLAPNFHSLSFLRFTPNLKKLEINMGISITRRLTKYEINYVSSSKVTELVIDMRSEIIANEDLEALMESLPNLKGLTMPLNNDQFSMVCKRWLKLLSLNVLSIGIDDTGITGFDLEDVETINAKNVNGTWRPVTVPRANITNLKGLQKFRMDNIFVYQSEIKLGYCAIVYGIQHLRNLEFLHISKKNFRLSELINLSLT